MSPDPQSGQMAPRPFKHVGPHYSPKVPGIFPLHGNDMPPIDRRGAA